MKITHTHSNIGFKAFLMFCAVAFFSSTSFSQGNNWKLNGNNNVSNSDFVGTKNNNDLIFKVNNQESFRLNATDFNSVFKTGSEFQSNVRLKYLEDNGSSSIRALGVNPNGDLSLLPNSFATFDSLHVLHKIKIGTSSLFLGSQTTGTPGTNNFIYTDNAELRINGGQGQSAIQNTFLNPDGGTVGINTDKINPDKVLHVNGPTFIKVDAPGTPENQNLFLMTTNTNNPCIQFMRSSTINSHIQEGDLAFLDNTGELKGLFRMGLDYNNNYENYFRFYSFHKNQSPDRETLMNISDDDITMFPYPSIWGGGNVGIGLENPQSKLHVKGVITAELDDPAGTTPYSLEVITTQNNNACVAFRSSTSQSDLTYFDANNDLAGIFRFNVENNRATWTFEDRTAGAPYIEKFKIASDGVVYAREIKVTLSTFPDYVFTKDYELMPIDELESYITTNQHLPNLPTEQEVLKDGIGVGELQNKLVEKVEELTLYVIELNKKIEQLQAENQALKK